MAPRNHVPAHLDPGLQPERTSLAWGRTTLTTVVAAAIFLRWTPHHGLFTGVLIALTLLAALVINGTQRARYHRAVHGIANETIHADVVAVLFTSLTVVALAALGIFTVVFLPVPG